MNNDITAQIRYEAEKRNLKESTIRACCNGTKYFLRSTGKDIPTLSIDDAESFLTSKRLNGFSAQTYNYYHGAVRFFL